MAEKAPLPRNWHLSENVEEKDQEKQPGPFCGVAMCASMTTVFFFFLRRGTKAQQMNRLSCARLDMSPPVTLAGWYQPAASCHSGPLAASLYAERLFQSAMSVYFTESLTSLQAVAQTVATTTKKKKK